MGEVWNRSHGISHVRALKQPVSEQSSRTPCSYTLYLKKDISGLKTDGSWNRHKTMLGVTSAALFSAAILIINRFMHI